MLYTETIHKGTLALLNELMNIDELNSFSLVGGTALSLKYGHRLSEDLDLFCLEDFDKKFIYEVLKKNFGQRLFYEERQNPLGIFCYIDGVKVDIIKYKFPLIGNIQTEENVRLYSTEDIVAMKIAAILRRGRKKDFWDIAELLQTFSIEDFVTFFYRKFPDQMLAISIPQAMTYFADAEMDDDPISLKKQTWASVKKYIQKQVNEYLK